MIQWLCEVWTELQEGEGGREFVHLLIKGETKGNEEERSGKGIHWLIEGETESEVGERGREVVHTHVKGLIQFEGCEGERERVNGVSELTVDL